MDFQTAVKTCFNKYADFSGRAKRSEFWWFFLFCFVISLLLEALNSYVSWTFSLATLLPSLAVGARRLHDIGKSGWWQLIWLIPVIGWIVLIVFYAQEGNAEGDKFGDASAS